MKLFPWGNSFCPKGRNIRSAVLPFCDFVLFCPKGRNIRFKDL